MTKEELSRRLGERLAAIRADHGMTQAELADEVRTAPNYISEIERGGKLPQIEMLARIAEAFGVSLSEIFVGVDRPLPRDFKRLDRALTGQPRDVQTKVLKIVEAALALALDPEA